MKRYLKSYLSGLKYFQNKRFDRFFFDREERFLKLKPDEQYDSKRIVYYKKNKIKQIESLFDNININLRYDALIQSWIDTGLYFVNKNMPINNTSPDYSIVLLESIEELKKDNELFEDNPVKKSNYKLLCVVEDYIDRIIKEYDEKIDLCPKEYKDSFIKSRDSYVAMKNSPAMSIRDALQRIAFWSDLFWQTGHNLMGLGRLDLILGNIPSEESEEDILEIIKEFYMAMHRYYPYKSSLEAMGDTGQIIVLGGKKEDGSYFCNRYTYLFIKALKEQPMPDPKLLLRVSEKMPDELLAEAVGLISTGVGSPLLANDDVIIPALAEFGYSKTSAYNYVTSACWEPLAYGNSSEVNNIRSINYAQVLVDTYSDDRFEKCVSYKEILDLYKEKMSKYLDSIIISLDSITWEQEPLLTLFTPNCLSTKKVINKGGAEYNNYGLLGDGVGNTVNSLLLIKNHVFGDCKYTLGELKEWCITDFANNDVTLALSKDSNYYGKDMDEVIDVAEFLKSIVEDKLSKYTNSYGGKVKWGISSSNYMRNGRETKATPDGRKSGENLNVHISGYQVPYTELFRFASRIDYKGYYSNGNVIDYFVSPGLINENFNKFFLFIKSTIKIGFFEQQLNVVSSSTLIDAKNNPEKYPNLIVRVWGFSAYFNELTDEYKEVLIKRAIKSEEILTP